MRFDGEVILQAVAEELRDAELAQAAHLEAARRALELDLEHRLEALPTPAPGRDGLDRVLVLPRHVGEAEPFDLNEIAIHAGGIWQAVRKGRGHPGQDPAGWRCLVPGIAAIESREDFALRELVVGFRMSDGTLHECRARMPAALLPPDYEARGWGVIAGDIVRDGDFDRIALVDNPGDPGDWQAREVRGRRGRDGKGLPGDPGRPGPGLTGLSLTRTRAGELAVLPAYADPNVRAEPLAIDLEPQAGTGRHIIRTFAGGWHAGASYGRGDVVGHGGGLWLSLAPDNAEPPERSRQWERMV